MNGPVITIWRNLTATKDGSEWQPDSWELVFKWLSESKPFRGNEEHPGWSAAKFEPCERAAANVRQVFALCLDYDNKGRDGLMIADPVTIAGATELWASHCGLIHTSRSHTDEWPRFRVVLPLSRPVSPFEYAALWLRVKAHAGAIDDSPKDPSRFWFLPGVKEGGAFEAHRLAGVLLAVDEWLARPEPQAPAERRPDPSARPLTPDRERILERARKYLAKMDGAVSGQHGHDATFSAACALARGFDLDEETTFRLLRDEYNSRCQPPWKDKELRHKAQQAREKGDRPFGYLLVDDREWEQPRRYQAPTAPRDDDSTPEPPEGYEEADSARDPGDDSEEIRVEQEKPQTAVERYGVLTEKTIAVAVFRDATSKEPARGFTTGIIELDEMMCGLRRNHVALIAGQTSFGKSTWGSLIVSENRKLGVKVLCVSNEDDALMYGRRLACSRLEINALRLRDRLLKPKELGVLGAYADAATDDYLLWPAIGVPIETVGRGIRELIAECGFQLVICDYLQRFRSNTSVDRRNEVTLAMGILADEIKKGGAAGVVFSQLKRTQGRPPTMDDVKESGDVENMAEHVLIGWREVEQRNGDPERYHRRVNIPKNKDGVASEEWMTLRFDEVRAAFIPGHVLDDTPERQAEQASRRFDDYGDNADLRYP